MQTDQLRPDAPLHRKTLQSESAKREELINVSEPRGDAKTARLLEFWNN